MPKSVLIVDDNDKNRKLLRVILENAGYLVREAENGEEGADAAVELRPDLVLMDYRMPRMDGIGATRRIKADPATAGTPVFIVTSSAMPGERERIEAGSGCDRLFTKPIDYRAILEAVAEALKEGT